MCVADWEAGRGSLACERAVEFEQSLLAGDLLAGFDAADGFQADTGTAGQFNLRPAVADAVVD